MAVGEGVDFQDFNLDELYFINTGAGANVKIVAVCIKMTPGRKKELEID